MYFVYILTTQNNTALYVGVPNDLRRRLEEHRNGALGGFSQKYRVKKLVYFEEYSSPLDAISREKQLKGWRRERKIQLIESKNPYWDELYLL